MKALRPALFFLVALGCFDPLYELGVGQSWTVCCRQGQIDTCECLDEAHCTFGLTACAGGTCVEAGSCSSGTGGGFAGGSGTGGSGTGGGLATGGGSGTGGGSAGGPADAGTVEDAGTATDAGQPADAGTGTPDAGTSFFTWEPCCADGRVTSCLCPNGNCSSQLFTPCSMGRCVARGASCPP